LATPKTIDEALALGHRELSSKEHQVAMTEFGATAHAQEDHIGLQPGDACAETPCANGFKLVMYVDDSGGCTRSVKVPC